MDRPNSAPIRMSMWLVALFCCIVAGGGAFAQQPLGNLAGTVTDPSGAVVRGATVTATSLATGATHGATTNDQGYFLLPTLQAGEYKLSISLAGFANFLVDRVVVAVGQTTNIEAQLKIASASETVQISGADAAAVVELLQASLNGVVNTRQIEQLPLNGRNYLELARLQPGVEIQEGRAFDPTKSRYTGVSIGSRNGREARITIDGVDAVDEHVGTTTLNISQETIQEFQISTSSSDTSAGISATGAINVITKRGSNQFHGSGFFFDRNNDFAARPNITLANPDFSRKQYGFSLGGPAIKERLFWFGSYEKTDENAAISINTAYFPQLTSFAAPFDENSSNVRTDWRVSQNHDAFLRWTRNENSNLGGFGGNRLPSSGNINTNTTHQFVIGLDSVLTQRLTNAFRVAGTDFKNRVLRPPAEAQAIGIAGLENIRILTGDGLLITGPDNITPQSTFERFYQFRDDLTLVGGRHTFRGGVDVVRYRVTVLNFVNGFPQFNVVSSTTRNPSEISSLAFINTTFGNKKGIRIPGTPDNSHRNTRTSFYGEDAWRVLPNLTLNFGARYQIDSHPLNNEVEKPTLVGPILPRGRAVTPIDKNNIAPTFGLAWDPWKNGKTSIRLGGGIYYTLRISNLVTNERASIAPFNSGNDTFTLTAGSTMGGVVDFNKDGVPDFDFSPILVAGTAIKDAIPVILAGQQVYIAAPASSTPTLDITRTGTLITNDLKTPYSQQFNIGVQRELPFNAVLDANFIYSRTVHEFMRDVDAANFFAGNGAPIILGDGRAPTSAITVITSDGFSRYRALTLKVDKRFAKRYQLTGSYALSRLETSTADGLGLGAGALVNRNPKANFGIGPLDRTHRLTLNGIIELPKGFRVSMISAWNSSVPMTALVGSADVNGDGINGDLVTTTERGAVGRSINSVAKLNDAIHAYHQIFAGKRNPRNQLLPFVPDVADEIRFGDSFISQDLQLSYVLKLKDRVKLEATAQLFNAFNVSNLVGAAGLPSSPFNGALATIAMLPTGFGVNSVGALVDGNGGRVIAGVSRLPNGALISSGFGKIGRA